MITGAGAGNSNIKSLVYVAAFAPDANEAVAAPGEKFSPPALSTALVPGAAGFLYVDRAKVHDVFAKDLSEADARIIAVTQRPVHNSVFAASVPEAAWKTIPSWFIVATQDRAINPELELLHKADGSEDHRNQIEPRSFHLSCE